MKLRSKVFLMVAIVLSIVFFAIAFALLHTLNKDFASLETRNARESISRVQKVLESKITDLSVKTSDWSSWDATYEFVQDHNDAYAEENLSAEALITLKVDFVFIADEKGKVIFKKYLNDNGEEVEFPEDLEEQLVLSTERVVSSGYATGNSEGILNTDEGSMIVTMQGTTTGDKSASPNGVLAFGYCLKQSVLEQLSTLTNTKVDFVSYEKASDKGEFFDAQQKLSESGGIYVENPGNSQYIGGYMLIDDIFGRPKLILRGQSERLVNEQRIKTVSLLAKMMFILAVAFIAIVFLLFEFLVLRKLSKFGEEIRKISQGENQQTCLAVSGNDELADLGREINKMLEALYNSDMQRRENEGRFRVLADSAPVIIWTADKEGNFTYINKKIVDSTGMLPENYLGEEWKKYVHKLDLPRVNAVLDQALEKKEPFNIKYRLQKTDGSYGWILMQATPEISYKGEFVGYLGSGFDITDVEEADARKLEYIKEIENMNKIMVSRELKMIELKEEISKLKKDGKSKSNN